MPLKGPILLFLLAAGPTPLAAQDDSLSGLQDALSFLNPATQLGLHALLVSPQGELRTELDGRLGFQVGAHWLKDLQQGFQLRPRVDYSRYDGGAFSFSSATSTTTLQGLGVGADLLRYLDNSHLGLYTLAGVDLTWWNAQYRFNGNNQGTFPGLKAGLGHRFNHSVAVEFDADVAPWRPMMGAGDSIKFGVFYNF
jgi:hypothetical protein